MEAKVKNIIKYLEVESSSSVNDNLRDISMKIQSMQQQLIQSNDDALMIFENIKKIMKSCSV
jgi:uncharacterized phage infection (PIP) family protein YhgE